MDRPERALSRSSGRPWIVAEAQAPLELVDCDRPPGVEVRDPCGHIGEEALALDKPVELRGREQDPRGFPVLRDDHGLVVLGDPVEPVGCLALELGHGNGVLGNAQRFHEAEF